MQKTYRVKIKGTTPLLQNRFNGDAEETGAKKRSQTSKENKVEDSLYQLPDGTVYQPAECIRQAVIEAGKAFKKGRSNLCGIFASFMMISPDAIPHGNQEWETDRRPVVIPSTKGRVMRNRAKLDNWWLAFDVQILDDDEISEKTLHDALDHAGNYIGIGDYRPQKKGIHGRFYVESINEEEGEEYPSPRAGESIADLAAMIQAAHENLQRVPEMELVNILRNAQDQGCDIVQNTRDLLLDVHTVFDPDSMLERPGRVLRHYLNFQRTVYEKKYHRFGAADDDDRGGIEALGMC
jgi:hypothetical protein